MTKPRIRKWQGGWYCVGFSKIGYGKNPRGAYINWIKRFYPYRIIS